MELVYGQPLMIRRVYKDFTQHCMWRLIFFIIFLLQNYSVDEQLCCVYVPTNHLYIGDIFLVSTTDIIRPNLSVREGIGESFFFHIYMFLDDETPI